MSIHLNEKAGFSCKHRKVVLNAILVIATGALSFPALGATDFGYRVARQFGVPIIEPRPGLVPIIPLLEDGSPWPFQSFLVFRLVALRARAASRFVNNSSSPSAG